MLTFTSRANRRHLLNFALASLTALSLSASLASETESERPASIRFVKTPLSTGEFYEPVEMAILPNLDVLIVQRRGEVLHFDQKEQEIYRVGFLDAYFESDVEGVNAEEGVLGITADPDFEQNNFVYIFYSPRDKVVNRLSRFVFKDRMLDMASEKVILEFFSQRDICCHTGGSLTFGPDRLLYLSTGDNSTPFDEKNAAHVTSGFAPLNEIADKHQYDARRSSANTNDLRGKILRIRILADGSYEIPEGNLFPASDKTRPEIYTMGHRNPYRISVDPKDGTLYWGDVGPDANEDKPERGPRGYDEMNRATQAGNFGWPLFVGNNYPYRDFDYATGESGPAFDPQAPINDSVNNTGLTALPPAKAPFIWYPYASSPDFPQVGSGGRNAMAGPSYHMDLYPESTRLAGYYDGKVIMHDWIRNWFIAVKFNPKGQIESIEPFLEHLKFTGPIDVEMGPDGRIYILEYGSGWFQKNADSGLSRIDYISGNLPPQIASLSVDRETGKLPLTVTAKAEVSDPEGDPIRYSWRIGSSTTTTDSPTFTTTLETAGAFELQLTATDDSGSSSTSKTIQLYAGNEKPQIAISVKGNQSLYFPDRSISYNVSIIDDTPVDPAKAYVSAKKNRKAAETTLGHKVLSRADEGEIILSASDCRACHKVDEASIGPAFASIAQRYQSDPQAETILSNKILKGGAGAWGEIPMPAHPAFSESEISKIVAYVLSHAKPEDAAPSLPLKGKLDPSSIESDPTRQLLILTASYSDSPSNGLLPLSAEDSITLYPSTYYRYWFKNINGLLNNSHVLLFNEKTASFQIPAVDLQGIKKLTFQHSLTHGTSPQVTIRIDRPDGPIIGSGTLKDKNKTAIRLKRQSGANTSHALYISFELDQKPGPDNLLESIEFTR